MSSDDSEPQPKKKKDDEAKRVCIVHCEGLHYGEILLLSETKDSQGRIARLRDIKEKRLLQPAYSSYRMEAACAKIPDVLENHHGYHTVCYQRFTANLNRLKPADEVPEATTSRPRRSSADKIIFNPDCIFCKSEKKKKIKKKGNWTTEGLCIFEKEGWKSVLETAERRSDEALLRRIRGHDLFAVEAKYHRSCRCAYLQDSAKWRSNDDDQKQKQLNMEEAHHAAFSIVSKAIEDSVIRDSNVATMNELRLMYVTKLRDTDFPNENFRSEKLKGKLQKKYKDRIAFCNLGAFKSSIIYNRSTDIETAIKRAYTLGSRDMIQDCGVHLHEVIIHVLYFSVL